MQQFPCKSFSWTTSSKSARLFVGATESSV
jgi:hypothetical protein